MTPTIIRQSAVHPKQIVFRPSFPSRAALMAGKKESMTVGDFVGTQRLEGLLAVATRPESGSVFSTA
jgi:hypothetical protein